MNLEGRDSDRTKMLEAFSDTAGVPRGLPGFTYTDRDFWRLENESLFRRHWIFAAFASELTGPGDAVPLQVGGMPIFLVRDGAGDIRAFHNACRHRGLKLVQGTCNVGRRLRCPYHSWVYGLDGGLVSTPHFGGAGRHGAPGFDPARHGLAPVKCAVWHDWVFVNLDPEPMDFGQYLAPLRQRLAGVVEGVASPVAVLDFGAVNANWKLLMENFIEPYHVQFVHAETTDQPLRDHRTIIDGRCLGSAVELSKPDGRRGSTLAVDSQYLTLFPNFVIGVYKPNQIGVHLNLPLDVDRTLQRRAIYLTGGGGEARDVAALEALWRRVHGEDHAICERVQQGKTSAAAQSGGVLSPHWENSVRRFQELVVEAVS